MSAADERLHEAALAWAGAFRERQAAAAAKRRVVEAVRLRGRHWGDPDAVFFAERDADRRLAEARAALRAATKGLLQIVDPKAITISVKAREISGASIERRRS